MNHKTSFDWFIFIEYVIRLNQSRLFIVHITSLYIDEKQFVWRWNLFFYIFLLFKTQHTCSLENYYFKTSELLMTSKILEMFPYSCYRIIFFKLRKALIRTLWISCKKYSVYKNGFHKHILINLNKKIFKNWIDFCLLFF